MAQTDVCVIYNPAAGRGQGARRLARIRKSWGPGVRLLPTSYRGHAIELARQAALADYRVVAAAGGDGTVHEVANGLLQAGRTGIRFGIIPIGSANDYYASLEMELDLKQEHAVDVGVVREPGGRQEFFVCCLGLGLNGAVNREARRIRRVQGIALYALATLRSLWHDYACPQMELTIDDQPAMRTPTLMFSALIGRREGGFPLAPHASVCDGWFDYVHVADLSRWQILKLLPRVALSGPPAEYPKVTLGRCRKIQLTSEAPLAVHLDGEFFCTSEENVRSLEIEIMPAALTVTRLAWA
jgi:diacylglycerol kinase (ATP)